MREDRATWNDYNMLLAMMARTRSPDPNTQVGAYICTTTNRPLALGYNGVPRGVDPHDIPWAREGQDPLETKYPYIAHAEKNAIFNATGELSGSKLYVTMHPCNGCAIDVIQAGITEVIYLTNPYEKEWYMKAASWMLKAAGVEVRKHIWENKLISLKNLDLTRDLFLDQAQL